MNRRQVHMDFHTGDKMPNVGGSFSKENFQKALITGHVNSITLFAKCHHGWCYYPTKHGKIHPMLGDFDLLGAQMDAAHEIGVRAPVYITFGWSEHDALDHPDWVAKDKDGNFISSYPYDPEATPESPRRNNLWMDLCPNTGYGEHVLEITREVCERYNGVDGLFYDIVFHGAPCYCDACKEGMRKEGLDPEVPSDAHEFFARTRKRFMKAAYDILKEYNPEGTIFCNGCASIYGAQWHDYQTHFEMEDLPTAGGRYDKMPMRAKYFVKSGKPYIGMTGKFHTDWGEFGGFKTPDALRYEAAAMIAYGAGCSVGDHCHPSGEMDLETYRIIGEAYDYVEKIEEYADGIKDTSRLGVMLLKESATKELQGAIVSDRNASDDGVVKMLLETQMDFQIIRDDEDLSKYDTIILPDNIVLDNETAAKINEFVKNGGGLLVSGDSGLDYAGKEFLIDVGAKYIGTSEFENDYIKVGDKLSEGMVTSPFLLYKPGRKVEVTDGEVLAEIYEPYSRRTYENFCGHKNTPYGKEPSKYPAAVKKGRVVYLAHKMCEIYSASGSEYFRNYFINALNLIYEDKVLDVKLMSKGRAVMWEQPEKNRYALHLLYATPIRRGNVTVIEDLPDIYNTPVKIKTDKKIKKVYLAPENKKVKFKQKDGYVTFTVDEFNMHTIAVLEY